MKKKSKKSGKSSGRGSGKKSYYFGKLKKVKISALYSFAAVLST